MPWQINGQVSRPLIAGEQQGADDAHRAGFRRRRKTHEDRAEHQEDQDERGHHAAEHFQHSAQP